MKFLTGCSWLGTGGDCLGSVGGLTGESSVRSLELSDDIEMLAGDVLILKPV